VRLAQLSEGQTARGCTIRRDEYNVDEHGGEVDAGSVNDNKDVRCEVCAGRMYDERRRQRGGIAACAVIAEQY